MYVAPTVEEFRQVAPIASAQGIGVVNGGYTYDDELVSLLPQVLPGVTVAGLDAEVIAAALDPVAPDEELAMARLLGHRPRGSSTRWTATCCCAPSGR